MSAKAQQQLTPIESTKVGIELEMVFKSPAIQGGAIHYARDEVSRIGLQSTWTVVQDGSVGDSGCEFVLRQPILYKEVDAALKLLDHLPNMTAYESPRCGTHIHIDCRDLNRRELVVFMIMCVMAQDSLYLMCPDHRVTNNFVTQLHADENLFRMMLNVVENLVDNPAPSPLNEQLGVTQPKRYHHVIPENQLKYTGLNFWSLSRRNRGSVEFRMFPSTLNPEAMKLWVNLLVHLKARARSIRGLGGLFLELQQLYKNPGNFYAFLFGSQHANLLSASVTKKARDEAIRVGLQDGMYLCIKFKQQACGGEKSCVV